MNARFVKRIKIFIISALVILVAGMSMLAFLGFNQPVDNKDSYEMQISVNQVAGNAVEVLQSASEKAIKDNEMFVVSEQKLNGGATLIYKFNKDVSDKIEVVEKAVQSALDGTNIINIEASVSVHQLKGSYGSQVLKVALGLGIGILVASIFVLILNKFASALSVLSTSVLSIVLFMALVALTRIPAQPYFAVFTCVASILSLVTSTIITTKYKAEIKKDGKVSSAEVVGKVNSDLATAFALLMMAVLLFSLIFGIITSVFVGLIMFVAGVVGLFTAIYFTPFMWAVIRRK